MSNPKKEKKKMKKFILSLGLVAMMLNLTNCAQYEDVNPTVNPQGDFELFASVSRTANDGLNTVWTAGDNLTVFHAEAGATTYVYDAEFTLESAETGRFTGTLNSALTAEAYDWYATYPHSSYHSSKTPEKSAYIPVCGKVSDIQTQNGNDSMAHIAGSNYPLVGVAKGVANGTAPAVAMKNVASLLEFEVTNSLDEAITVTNITLTAPEYIIGTFYVHFADIDNVSVTSSGASYTSKTATLAVKNGTAIAKGETGKFYLAVAPFVAAANSSLSLEVNVTSGEKVGMLSKTITLANETAFVSGKIKPIAVNYNVEFVSEGLALPFEDDFAWVTKDEGSGVLALSDLAEYYTTCSTIYGSVGEIKFGKSDVCGSLTTVPFNLSQPFTVVVDAMAYSSDVSQLAVTVNGVTKKTGNLAVGTYKKYKFEFDAATAASSVKLDITGKRGYIDNLEIVSGHDYVLPPVLTLNPESLTFEDTAGSKTITCTIDNEVEGTEITATESVDWITTSVSGNVVTVTVTANTGTTDRDAKVTIAYEGANSKEVTVLQLAPAAEGSEEVTETMSIFANKGSLSNKVITWTGTNFTFSNAQGSSSTAIRTSDSDHFRIYANSTITFTAKNSKKFKKIEITCTSSSYATALKNTLGDAATASGSTVTWTGSAETVTKTATAQIRINKIVATLQ